MLQLFFRRLVITDKRIPHRRQSLLYLHNGVCRSRTSKNIGELLRGRICLSLRSNLIEEGMNLFDRLRGLDPDSDDLSPRDVLRLQSTVSLVLERDWSRAVKVTQTNVSAALYGSQAEAKRLPLRLRLRRLKHNQNSLHPTLPSPS